MISWRGRLFALGAALLLAGAAWLLGGWIAAGPLAKDTEFVVRDGENLNTVTEHLLYVGAIDSTGGFRLRTRLLGGGAAIKSGTFVLPKGASQRTLLDILHGGRVVGRFVPIPVGLPSIRVLARLWPSPT